MEQEKLRRISGWSEVVIECPSCHGIGHLNIISVNKREDIEDNYLG